MVIIDVIETDTIRAARALWICDDCGLTATTLTRAGDVLDLPDAWHLQTPLGKFADRRVVCPTCHHPEQRPR